MADTPKSGLQVFRAQHGAYDRVVAVADIATARKLLGSPDVHLYTDDTLGRKIKRRPGVVWRKLRGGKSKYQVWD